MTWEKYCLVPASIWSQGMTRRPLMGTALQLDAGTRAGGIPRPVGELHVGRDFARLRPGAAVVAGTADKHPARVLAGLVDDLGFVVVAAIPSVQQPDDAGLGIADNARIAAGVGAVIPDHAQPAPGFAAVFAELADGVNIPGIAAAALATLADGQQVSRAIHRDGWDAEGVVALGAADEGRGLKRGNLRLGRRFWPR